MAEPNKIRPVLLIAAVTSRYPEAFDWVHQKLRGYWGPISIKSESIPFDMTSYYTQQMGGDLQKQLIGFEKLVDPGRLADFKLQAIALEDEYASSHQADVDRPINIDPGYVTEAKLVLASTKNRDHRIYIGQGIFAEITMYYQQKEWQHSRWTYQDYMLPQFVTFLTECRLELRRRYATL